MDLCRLVVHAARAKADCFLCSASLAKPEASVASGCLLKLPPTATGAGAPRCQGARQAQKRAGKTALSGGARGARGAKAFRVAKAAGAEARSDGDAPPQRSRRRGSVER